MKATTVEELITYLETFEAEHPVYLSNAQGKPCLTVCDGEAGPILGKVFFNT